jgi:acyl transferase domain-containing protein/NAD(P)H-dependent flavin oxidoreductase YrpB (nitropropane dioxygenase family)/NAD(P)-dependent dehydrogenase (short-subunit alcohol dehydrogenase family)
LPGVANPSIAIAASRAGGIGVLDLEYVWNEPAALAGLAQLTRYTRQACGVKLDAGAESFMANVTSELPAQITVVILTRAHPVSLRRQVQTLRRQNRRVFLETLDLEQALLGEEVGVDGLIVKGHEAGGRVSEETSFILLQRLIKHVSLPMWVQGGIGLHTAAACYIAGAAGLVLDAQLTLTRESGLPESVKASIARMDGSETRCLGSELGEAYRMYTRPGPPAVQALQQLAQTLAADPSSRSDAAALWRQEVRARVGWDDPERHVWLLGQEAAFAVSLAERFRTVGGVLEGMRQAITTHIRTAKTSKPLAEAAVLARSHGTRYPIVQGPMTRVSDRAAFAARVADEGGLPFLALALMRAPEVEALLAETRQMLGDRPWGVGILGFVPLELRQEQLEVIRTYRPAFALIAGGRPDQALTLEQVGIPTYLHVPSPGLLKLFIEHGARRFVFEGRECGGHVGPRSSFVLWNTMIDTLLDVLPTTDMADCHVLFAGGIHDAISTAMVATLAAPLAERQVKIGVLLGTAYVFTQEAVSTGAILQGFQQEAIRCTQTVLLESGPGHATRCAATSYAEIFEREKQQLAAAGRSMEDIREALEELNLGRLRIASKGISRHPGNGQDSQTPRFMTVSAEEQGRQGMYMLGQVAALRDSTCTIAELHHEVSSKGSEWLVHVVEPVHAGAVTRSEERPCDVAIVGMACLFPKAPNLQTYWENILNKVDVITEVPKDRWDWQRYFDADPKTPDKIYSKWGGFLDDVPFDPMLYGMPPSSLSSIEPLQLLTLEVVHAALQDAGYLNRPFPRQRTAVILGVGGGIADLGQQYALRAGLPMFFENASPEVLSRLPEWTEDSFAGILLNVTAGRVANRFDLGGVNYTVDAACASSLAAVYLATRELEAGTSDMVLVGGGDTVQNPFGYLCFSKTHAFSPRGRCRTFDESADGMVISEGIAVLVLKRMADAERDGDRIYAVIKSVAGSSDGRDKGLTAPRPEGQALALQRAYAKAGFSPATVGLLEAHGTGTVAGDQAEVETLKRVFAAAGAAQQSCAVGSVKSMIGHTKCTAGVAGLMKIALALYHKVLPPTMHVEKPNPKAGFPESPFYVNTEPHPWVDGVAEDPRRAGVSAFGFGGTNFHAVLEEYTGNFLDSACQAVFQDWPGELLLWVGNSRQDLLTALESLAQALAQGAKPALRDLAYTLWQLARERSERKLAVVATSLDDLRQKLTWAQEALRTPGRTPIYDPRGIYYTEAPLAREGKVAFLFSGQGSQYPNMLCELALHFPEVRERFELADRLLADQLQERLSTHVFPPPCFTPEEERTRQQALTQTNIAQPALGAASMGLFCLLRALGVQPHAVAGHSYGEYVALCSAAVFSEEVLYMLSEARGRCIIEASGQELGTMAAVAEEWGRVRGVLQSVEDVWIANVNAPRQTVISGTRQGVEQAIEHLGNEGIQARLIPVACAFHSPVIAPARERLDKVLSSLEFHMPQLEVFSNATAAPYPHDPEAIAALLAEHLVSPVRFADEVEAMYGVGTRIFVEVGPRNVLTSLTTQILGDRPHLSVASDVAGRPGLLQLLHMLGQLAVHDTPLTLDRLYRGRAVRQLNLAALEAETRDKPLSPTTWLVNGGRARPLNQAHMPAAAQGAPPLQEVGNNGRDQAPVRRMATPPASSAWGDIREDSSPPRSTSAAEQPAFAALTPQSEPPAPTQARSVSGIPTALPSNHEAGRVMLQFQQLMNRFLETQQQVMLTYLHGATDGTSPAAEVSVTAVSPDALPVPPPPQPLYAVASTSTSSDMRTSANPVSPPTKDSSAATPASVQEVQPVSEGSQMTNKLLQIVSERTGYPLEMLDMDLDLEADLGIDSIKRVEILGAFQSTYRPPDQDKTQNTMEQLTKVKTLRGIMDSINSLLLSPQGDQCDEAALEHDKVPALQSSEIGAEGEAVVPRFVPIASVAPHNSQVSQVRMDGTFVITDDEQGVAQALAEALRRYGVRIALIRMTYGEGEVRQDVYTANLTDPAAVTALLEHVRRQQGSIVGLIHMLPLQAGMPFKEMDLAGWRNRLLLEVKSLFLLAKAVGPDLKHASRVGGSWLVAATAMGGAFASDAASSRNSFWPSHGAVAGLVKTLALEWPQVQHKVIDLDVSASPAQLAEQLLGEIVTPDAEVEVGYTGSRRVILRPRSSPLDLASPKRLVIDPNWVVLVTGGARGITAKVVCELATHYKPTLLLVGRSPLPELEEAPRFAGLTSPRELKAALMDEMRGGGQAVTPARVEAAYARLLRDREIRSNLAVMQQAGATVHYYQVDVRDERAFGHLIDEIYRLYGRVDGVIHGAGVIEDKLLEDKAPDSFDRVLDTKVVSAFVLSRKLQPDLLKFLVFFSSVSGRFGNRGQGDYAAANEVLNKLALYLDRQWQGRVVSINWGPWEQTGMVSAEVQRQFAERGVQMIPPQAGWCALDRELQYGRKGEVEVILGRGPWNALEAEKPIASLGSFPLLADVPIAPGSDGSLEVVCRLDPSAHLYLQDHQLDTKSVLPAAMAMELMAEVVQKGWPEWKVVGIRALRVLKGIIIEDSHKSVRIVARPHTPSSQEQLEFDVDVEITEPEQVPPGLACYRAMVQLAATLPEPPPYALPPRSSMRQFPMSVDKAYCHWLFHGPCFQCISEIEGISDHGIIATVAPSSPQHCLVRPAADQWLIDPIVIDSGPQLAILWARAYKDMTALPSSFQGYRRYGSLSGSVLRCYFQVLPGLEDHTLRANVFYVGADDRLLGCLEGLECTCSKALNRLARGDSV